ncbi:MAG: hypothetical protein ACI8U3_001490 [Brevundimonas sp.]|jgi:hypothetical protein
MGEFRATIVEKRGVAAIPPTARFRPESAAIRAFPGRHLARLRR